MLKEKEIINSLLFIRNSKLLSEAFNVVLGFSENLYCPYHNFNHIMNTTNYTFDISVHCKEKHLSTREIELLMLSALFHDFNHACGRYDVSDFVNIGVATTGVMVFNNMLDKDMSLSSDELEMVMTTIEATEYPYKKKGDELNLYQKILRDADLSQIFQIDTYIGHNVLGLKKELNIENVTEMVVNQGKFIESVEFETEYMRSKIEAKEITLDYNSILLNILED